MDPVSIGGTDSQDLPAQLAERIGDPDIALIIQGHVPYGYISIISETV